jgi:hypothetical protein
MNEALVKQLADQNERIANLYNIGPVQRAEVTQFVEAIVRECISIAQDRAAFDWALPNDVNHIIDEIKEHFGVEL